MAMNASIKWTDGRQFLAAEQLGWVHDRASNFVLFSIVKAEYSRTGGLVNGNNSNNF